RLAHASKSLAADHIRRSRTYRALAHLRSGTDDLGGLLSRCPSLDWYPDSHFRSERNRSFTAISGSLGSYGDRRNAYLNPARHDEAARTLLPIPRNQLPTRSQMKRFCSANVLLDSAP